MMARLCYQLCSDTSINRLFGRKGTNTATEVRKVGGDMLAETSIFLVLNFPQVAARKSSYIFEITASFLI